MNKRRREILAALEPAVAHAMPNHTRQHITRDVPGLALHARVDASAPAEILLYGPIGQGGMFSEGISGSDVAAVLRAGFVVVNEIGRASCRE